MALAAMIVAILALLLALAAWRGRAGLARLVEEQGAVARRAEAHASEADERARRLEHFAKLLAAGAPLTPGQIEEGRLFDEIDADAARRLVEEERPVDLLVVDVRTAQEVQGGHIPGALWIPVDEIEGRAREVPRDKRILVFCAAGGRSAAACDHLSTRGWTNLTNVVGGMSAWKGEVARGLPGPR